jgi:leucyl/phenylalanyl-tRNA---protein transferase
LMQECRARDIQLIDCQVASSHLASLGAREVSRDRFVALLQRYARRSPIGSWADDAA